MVSASVLDRLSTVDTIVAEVHALLDTAVSKSTLLSILAKLKADVLPGGQRLVMGSVPDSIARLKRHGVLTGSNMVAAQWRDTLALQALRRPTGKLLVAALYNTAPKCWIETHPLNFWQTRPIPDDVDLARSIRLLTMLDDESRVASLVKVAEAAFGDKYPGLAVEPILFRSCPTALSFVAGLNPALRDRVAAAHVERLLDSGVCDEGLAGLIEGLRGQADWEESPKLDRALMRLDVLAQRPDEARARMLRVRGWDPIAVLGVEATLVFLEGSGTQSVALFRDALKQLRKVLGRRRVVLPGEAALFHVLALLATGEQGLIKEAAGLLEIIGTVQAVVAWATAGLLELLAGHDDAARETAAGIAAGTIRSLARQSPLAMALTTLSLAVIDGPKAAAREAGDQAAVGQWGGQLPVAAGIIAQAHGRVGSQRDSWVKVAERCGPGYARDFLDIVPVRPQWDRALDRLQAFLTPQGSKAEVVKSRRLVFLFDAGTLEITPLEQASKRDGWSVGRPVSLKRLYKRDGKLDYLGADDERVIKTLRGGYGGYYDDEFAFDPIRGPLALVGHPHVFDAGNPAQAVELTTYPVELVVREERDMIRITLSHQASEPQVFVDFETPGRWRVVEITPALVELGAILGRDGLQAPKEARERAVALVKTDNPRLPVRSELAGVETGSVEGGTVPILQIAPGDDGFTVRARVRPLGADGPVYLPGLGSSSVLVPSDGAHRRVNRRLADESAALEVVVDACPALSSWRDSAHSWRIEALDAMLEALQELYAFAGPLVLEWPDSAPIKPTRSVTADAVSLSIASGRDWFEVKGEVKVDEGLVLDMADVLSRLSTSRGRFIALDDGRYLALTEDLRRRLDGFAALTEPVKGGRRIAAAGAGALDELVGSAGAVKADRRWTEMLARLAAVERYQPEVPHGLGAELRDYQMAGFAWLARLSRLGLGACLADDMGLGKTVQTLALLLNDAARGPSLVVAPTSVCHNWVLEAGRFAPSLRVLNLAAAADRAGLVGGLVAGDVLVVSYGLLHTEADLLASCRFAVAVFDEAHQLKNAGTRRAQASKRIEAEFRLALSGTPVENRLEELWSLYDTVNPGLLGSRESFQRRFAGPIERGLAGPEKQALKTLLRPFLLRRTKASVLTELPSRTEVTVEVEAGEEERAFYEAVRRQALERLADTEGVAGQKRIRILAEIMRLRRAACHPALVNATAGVESAKLARLLDLAAELIANRHRVLVFSQFTGHLDLVEAALRGANTSLLRLDGSTTAKDRALRVDAFQAGQADVFLISLKAGGVGLNLTAADYVIHLDPWWNPAVEDQATDRAHRIGQTLPVTVYRLVMKDSIEEQILAMHATKRALSADFLDGADQAGALGEEELMALIRG